MFTVRSVNVCPEAASLGMARRTDGTEVEVFSGIIKYPVHELFVNVGPLGVEGDIQVDTGTVRGKQVHGGEEKAVYAMTIGEQQCWSAELGVSPGATFGENFTLDGPGPEHVYIDDEYRCNDLLLKVTGARRPCKKLAMHLGEHVPRRMIVTGWTGWYFRVLEPGVIRTDGTAELALISRFADRPTVAQVFRGKMQQDDSVPGIRAADS